MCLLSYWLSAQFLDLFLDLKPSKEKGDAGTSISTRAATC